MSVCSLCAGHATDGLDRFSGLDLCTRCRAADPAPALEALGLPIEWNFMLGRFSAGAGIGAYESPDFHLRCVQEWGSHRIVKLFVHEVEVGDPVFDDRIFVRTSDPARAAEVLTYPGVQSALLGLLAHKVHKNEIGGHHVTVNGPTLTVSIRPVPKRTPGQLLDLKLETAALALHLRSVLSTRAPRK